MTTPESAATALIGSGYTEVQEHAALKVGDRVRHVGEQYTDAYQRGSGVIERIFVRGERDVELIVKRDKPRWSPTDTHGYWADYHTVKVSA